MLVWEENPVYWTIDWENPATYQNAENQLSELIARDKNRASVIIWSMANETPNVPTRNEFLNKLAAFARSKDETRLISAAQSCSKVSVPPLFLLSLSGGQRSRQQLLLYHILCNLHGISSSTFAQVISYNP
ncbi:MAG: glycoside hydrolase family 2 TIM barrel-domain containing protein [Bacteroidota bacterium]